MKYVVIFLAVVGFSNFMIINHEAFSTMTKTVLTQRGKNIPSRLYRDVTSHHWRFTPEKKR